MYLYSIVAALVVSTVATHPLETDNSLREVTVQTNLTCFYKEAEYLDGDTILLEEPCLACTCQKGALVCSLRVCPKLPDPPPPGCVVVHKKNQCCPQITCEDVSGLVETKTNIQNIEPEKGCSMNGGLYSEGSALPSSSLCEFCFCMQGQQRCTSPHCGQPHEDCHPIYSPYSCCPVHYNCTQIGENYRKMPTEEGCVVNGTQYKEGDLMDTWTSNPCKTCYCIQGEVTCQPVRCTIQHMDGCYPVYTHDRCCPVAYNCSLREPMNDTPKYGPSIDRSLRVDVEEPTTAEPQETALPESTITSTPETTWESTTEYFTTEEVNATEVTEVDDVTTSKDEILSSWSTNESTTTEAIDTTNYPSTTQEPEIITIPIKYLKTSLSSNLRMENSNATPDYVSNEAVERAKPHTADELLLNSTQADEDYESYDYSDAKLPPSLPNLVIFPFVAADAVTKEKEKYTEAEKKSDQVPNPAYYSPFFNPPIETQGGFVPKDDPTPDTATFQPIYFDDKVPIIGEDVEPIADHASITMPPKSKTETCMSEGKEYKHGEELPQLMECISCVCQHGDIMCEEVMCAEPAAGCHRSETKPDKACCAPIVCEPVKIYTTPTPLDVTLLPPNITDVVLEPIISTDSSLRDVIRTEPAPDLPSLMGDILPFLMDQQTKKPVTVNYKNKVVNYYPKHQVTTTNDRLKTTLTIEDHVVVVSSTKPYDLNYEQTSSSPVYRPTQSFKDFSTSTSLSETGEENETSAEVSSLTTTTVDTPEEITKERNEQFLSTVRPELEKIPTLIGVKPKPTKPTTTTEEGSFFDEFLKGFFESNDEKNATTPTPSKMHHIYSSKIRDHPILPTTTMASVEIIQNKEGQETETGSFSLDKVLDMLFQAEATEAAVTKTTKPKNSTKNTRKPQRKTKKPTSTTVSTTTIESTTVSTNTTTQQIPLPTTKTTIVPPSFVTDHNTGFPKINILEQMEKSPYKIQDQAKGHVTKQTESSRKPTKVSGGMGGMLKLAGCNIYGRMYRVGKIIAELTNACMECMCTESGVQCSKINC